jgi:hypothetical protein
MFVQQNKAEVLISVSDHSLKVGAHISDGRDHSFVPWCLSTFFLDWNTRKLIVKIYFQGFQPFFYAKISSWGLVGSVFYLEPIIWVRWFISKSLCAADRAAEGTL